MATVDNDYCQSCEYFHTGHDRRGLTLPMCIYILKTGTRRPCPGGLGCTAYMPKEAGESEWEKIITEQINPYKEAKLR